MRLFEPMLLEECACQLVHGEESASVSAPHLVTISSLTEVLLPLAVIRAQHVVLRITLLDGSRAHVIRTAVMRWCRSVNGYRSRTTTVAILRVAYASG